MGSLAPTRELRKLDLQKKRGYIGAADGRVENAHDTIVFPTAEGSFHLQGEMGAEDLFEDADIIVKHACKDGGDQPNSKRVYETSHARCKRRCFF